jgi:CBS domain-containing protein
MAQTIREVMTRDPRTVEAKSTVAEAAKLMREADVGPVVVTDGNKVTGIVTDRDVAVRAVAMDRDPKTTAVREICSSEVVTLSPDDSVGDALEVMRQRNVRRVPVVEGNKPVGILSLGDLAVDRDPNSVLGDISSSSPNR